MFSPEKQHQGMPGDKQWKAREIAPAPLTDVEPERAEVERAGQANVTAARKRHRTSPRMRGHYRSSSTTRTSFRAIEALPCAPQKLAHTIESPSRITRDGVGMQTARHARR